MIMIMMSLEILWTELKTVMTKNKIVKKIKMRMRIYSNILTKLKNKVNQIWKKNKMKIQKIKTK